MSSEAVVHGKVMHVIVYVVEWNVELYVWRAQFPRKVCAKYGGQDSEDKFE